MQRKEKNMGQSLKKQINSEARQRLALNLQMLRKISGKTFDKISEETGLSKTYLVYLEDAKNMKNPSMEVIDKLAECFNVDIETLFQK